MRWWCDFSATENLQLKGKIFLDVYDVVNFPLHKVGGSGFLFLNEMLM